MKRFGASVAVLGTLIAGACQEVQHATFSTLLPPGLIPAEVATVGLGMRIEEVVKLRPATRGMPYTGAFEQLGERWIVYRTDPLPLDDHGFPMPKNGAVVEEATVGSEPATKSGFQCSLFGTCDRRLPAGSRFTRSCE